MPCGGEDTACMIESERDLFVHELRELYHIERELEELQAQLAESATDEDLEEYYAAHSETTTDQIARLEPIFEGLQAEPGPVESSSLDGLRSEREAIVEDLMDPILGDLTDAELGRAIERLEITKLETLLTLADRMDLPGEIVDPLEQTKRDAEQGLEQLQRMPM
ncbi:Ferritin-like metal-binding protein YciE [Natronorubrum sediminis]|uniref:Ferritin-like metal-binding protein YciE n=2 Tax=Natronorubrum sediminis TaxID=640943 RepID=A0A1H6FP65_9EURY|nr:Ferritin-like metal-binding protein YciE [Natronorubrum sediminis]